MAAALVRINSAATVGTNSSIVDLEIAFVGEDVDGGSVNSEVQATILGSESVLVAKTKMSEAIAAQAVNLGFTCDSADMLIPAFTKG